MARNKKYSRCQSAPPADSRTTRCMRQGRAKSREKNSRRSQFLFFSRQNFLCVFPPYSIQLTPYYKRLPLHYSLFFTAPTPIFFAPPRSDPTPHPPCGGMPFLKIAR